VGGGAGGCNDAGFWKGGCGVEVPGVLGREENLEKPLIPATGIEVSENSGLTPSSHQ